jgi:predicted DCC family thiol-disulfide oxidoreductase YuxK
MQRLTVLYDSGCALCVRCRDWMHGQASFVELDFLACYSEDARVRYGAIPWLGGQLVVVADDGRVWAGSAAFLLCLWALVDWREWSYRLSGPSFAPLAQRFFQLISAERHRIAALLDHRPCAADACSLAPRPGPSGGPYR